MMGEDGGQSFVYEAMDPRHWRQKNRQIARGGVNANKRVSADCRERTATMWMRWIWLVGLVWCGVDAKRKTGMYQRGPWQQ